MGLDPAAWAPSKQREASGAGDSVTDVGEPALVRATALEITRGTLLAGRYQVEAVIGRGGSGIVLRAFDRVAQVPVAVKILKPDLASDPRWIERFSRELRLARQIQHSNVCRVFDIGQADGHWFITMELATAGTLRDQLGKHADARTTEEKVADIRAVAGGLAAIHEAGIVHRDVKPDNFLRMADGRLVLTDFGLATNPADAPIVSIMVGTPHYMAPEVVMGEPAAPESDVWSAGVVIHEILLGTRPERTSPTRSRVSEPNPESPSVERELLRITKECLAEEQTERPQDGPTLYRLLDDIIANRGHARKRAQRLRSSRIFWGAVAVAMVALIAASSRRMFQPAAASFRAPSPTASFRATGTPQDWSRGARTLAQIDGRVHCFSVLPGSEKARIVWGAPRKAEDIDLATGERRDAPLTPETFATSCPQLAPNGEHLLFTAEPHGSSARLMLADADGKNPRPLVAGTDPLWLPNGEEFIFNVDNSHVGAFSLPTMSYNLFNDERGQSKRFFDKKAVSARGDLIAVMSIEDNTTNRVLDMLALPGLDLRASWKLPLSIRDVSFDDATLYLADTGSGGALERFDWRTGVATRAGTTPGQTLRSTARTADGLHVLLSSISKSDVWVYEPGRAPQQLTHDGRNYSSSWSPAHEVLVERALDDDHFVIVRYDANGKETQVTPGPEDCLPSFSADGTAWLYVNYAHRAIVRCHGSQCAEVTTEPQLPQWPVMSPDSQSIAFVTVYGTPRIHVMDANGGTKHDLGPTAIECPPVWTSNRSLWSFSGAGAEREWAELDVVTGRRTGRTKPAPTFNPDDQTCGWESEPPTSPFFRHTRVVSSESWQIMKERDRLVDRD
jgi:serine/threonine-protein kinase